MNKKDKSFAPNLSTTQNHSARSDSVFFSSLFSTIAAQFGISSILFKECDGEGDYVIIHGANILPFESDYYVDYFDAKLFSGMLSISLKSFFSVKPNVDILQIWHKIIVEVLPLLSRKQEIIASKSIIVSPEPCPSLIEKLPLIMRYSASNECILIHGEPGTGKRFLAKMIHELTRSNEPLIEIEFNNIPESLIEIELFGYSAGAFTDGTETRPGKLSLAKSGTVLIRNIENVNKRSQMLIKNMLQQNQYFPIGSPISEKIESRFIITSKHSPKELQASAEILPELYYMINVLPIYLKPLKQRLSDLAFFCKLFLSYNNKHSISTEVEEYIKSYSWPGNLHELLNFLAWSSLQSGDAIVSYLPEQSTALQKKGYKETINQYKRNLIHDIVKQCNGNQTKAAKILGIQRTYLSRLIKELSIPV